MRRSSDLLMRQQRRRKKKQHQAIDTAPRDDLFNKARFHLLRRHHFLTSLPSHDSERLPSHRYVSSAGSAQLHGDRPHSDNRDRGDAKNLQSTAPAISCRTADGAYDILQRTGLAQLRLPLPNQTADPSTPAS